MKQIPVEFEIISSRTFNGRKTYTLGRAEFAVKINHKKKIVVRVPKRIVINNLVGNVERIEKTMRHEMLHVKQAEIINQSIIPRKLYRTKIISKETLLDAMTIVQIAEEIEAYTKIDKNEKTLQHVIERKTAKIKDKYEDIEARIAEIEEIVKAKGLEAAIDIIADTIENIITETIIMNAIGK